MSKCERCPVGPERPCVVEAGADPWFCTVQGDPVWRAFVLAQPATVSTPAPAFPPCPHRGEVVESGEGCRCGPKHLCLRDTRVVSAADCVACLAL